MAKTLVIDADEKARVPFLRGILTRSLQDAGLSFEQAYEMASDIRQQLAETEEITSEDLRKMVAEYLRQHSVYKVLVRYQALSEQGPIITVEDNEGHIAPYSSIQLSRELEIVGLKAEQIQKIVTNMSRHMLERGRLAVDSNYLGNLTYRYLRQAPDCGLEVADRYLTLVNFTRSGKPLILLIGGTTATGKSTVATAIANRLDIVRYQSTDMLREVMRMMIPERLLPVLHRSSFNAGSALPVAPCQEGNLKENTMIAGFRTQADLLSVPCEAVIQRGLKEKVSLILEGVHVQPDLLKQIPHNPDAVVVHVMLAVLKQKVLKKRIKGRSTKVPQRRFERYIASFDDIWHLQTYLLDEADEHDTPIVINEDKEDAIREIMKIVINRLMDDFSSTPAEVFGKKHSASKE